MKVGFPCYTTDFLCDCSKEAAIQKILDPVSCQHKRLKVLRAYYTGSQKIVLRAFTDGFLYRNSFLPIAEVEIKEADCKAQVSIIFELQKSTKIGVTILSAFIILLEIAMIGYGIAEQLSTFALVCLPLGLLVGIYIFSDAGLYFSSRGVLKTLFEALGGDDAKDIPSIHKPRRMRSFIH